jgi:hypothetical protein
MIEVMYKEMDTVLIPSSNGAWKIRRVDYMCVKLSSYHGREFFLYININEQE